MALLGIIITMDTRPPEKLVMPNLIAEMDKKD